MMRVYVHDTKTGGEIETFCKKAGLDVLTHEEVMARDASPADVSFFLDEVDALIIEITHPTQQVHFILAQAILADKPALCLYGKNQAPRELLSYIKKRPAPRPIKTFSYTAPTLLLALKNFVVRHDDGQDENEDLPTIKYTLRMSPRIDRYLQWVTETNGINKADFLRELLARVAEEDVAYNEGDAAEELPTETATGDS